MAEDDRARPWWRRLLAMLVPSRPDLEMRLATLWRAEVKLARDLMRHAERLVQYPLQRVGVVRASEHAQRRAERLQRSLEGLGCPVRSSVTVTREEEEDMPWERLRTHISELDQMSEVYLTDAHAERRDHPETAGLLLELHRESAEDRRELVWTLGRLGAPERLSERTTTVGLAELEKDSLSTISRR